MPTKKRRALGALTDNPQDIMRMAWHELSLATRVRNPLIQRQAAEKAHLALSSAIEVASRQHIARYSETLKAVAKIAERRRDAALVSDYRKIRQELHGDCFHGAQCGSFEALGEVFRRADRVLDRILPPFPAKKR